MVTLQKYLDGKFVDKQDVRKININDDAEEVIKNELRSVDGGELDLTAYSNLEELIIDSNYLKTPLTKLVLGNQP